MTNHATEEERIAAKARVAGNKRRRDINRARKKRGDPPLRDDEPTPQTVKKTPEEVKKRKAVTTAARRARDGVFTCECGHAMKNSNAKSLHMTSDIHLHWMMDNSTTPEELYQLRLKRQTVRWAERAKADILRAVSMDTPPSRLVLHNLDPCPCSAITLHWSIPPLQQASRPPAPPPAHADAKMPLSRAKHPVIWKNNNPPLPLAPRQRRWQAPTKRFLLRNCCAFCCYTTYHGTVSVFFIPSFYCLSSSCIIALSSAISVRILVRWALIKCDFSVRAACHETGGDHPLAPDLKEFLLSATVVVDGQQISRFACGFWGGRKPSN
jgi:hypothetical protein